MSGGSYNYLCYASDVTELIEKASALQAMLDRLESLGYAEDAAAETEQIQLILEGAERRIMRRMARLKDVWQAVEWWDSCDYSEDQVKEALARYREGER